MNKVMFFAIAMLGFQMHAAAQNRCESLEPVSLSGVRPRMQKLVEPAVKILSRPASASTEACILRALEIIEYEPKKEALPVVLRWLTWKRSPLSEVSVPTRMKCYPALSTLLAFGKSVIPDLLTLIAHNPPDSLAGTNALHTFMAVHRDNIKQGLELLRKEAESRKGSEKEHLHAAAESGAGQWRETPRGSTTKNND
jgi:hypothetical protein